MNISDLKCPSCGRCMTLTRASCRECGITIEGNLEISSLGKLSREDQAFVIALLRSGGNLTKTGELFGISYPTVKTRLSALRKRMSLPPETKSASSEVLDRLEKGEIDFNQAMGLLE